jgi:hypothetical protein
MPKVFISATSHDLKSYRKVVTDWAVSRGYAFEVQECFGPQESYQTICTMLRNTIASCDAVIHLAGFYYGSEPKDGPKDERRRSYTQLEFEIFRVFGRKSPRMNVLSIIQSTCSLKSC